MLFDANGTVTSAPGLQEEEKEEEKKEEQQIANKGDATFPKANR